MANYPGLKIIYCLKRPSHLTPAEFSRHWREVHAPFGRAAQVGSAHSSLCAITCRSGRAFRAPARVPRLAGTLRWRCGDLVRESAGLGDARPRPGRARRKSGIAGGRTTSPTFLAEEDAIIA